MRNNLYQFKGKRMDTIIIKRLTNSGNGTFGDIYLNNIKIGVTLEPTSLKIQKDTYHAKVYNSPRFHRKVIKLEDKNGRTFIEIHAGNYVRNSTGCILVGSVKKDKMITSSIATLNKLINKISTPNNIEVIVK